MANVAPEILVSSGRMMSTENLPIRYDLYEPVTNKEDHQPKPGVIFLHGFKGFKDWGPFPQVCREIAKQGLIAIAMNCSRNGVGESRTEFDRLDLFADQTLSQDLADVRSLVECLKSESIQPQNATINSERLGIVGHSRGGHTAVVAAAELHEIACLVTWSAVANYNNRWSKEMIEDWNQKGYTTIVNGRTGQEMRINRSVYEDATTQADRLMAERRIPEVSVPTAIFHGEEDQSVSPAAAERLYELSGAEAKNCLLFPDTGHTFGGAHPHQDETLPMPLNKVTQLTAEWLHYYL